MVNCVLTAVPTLFDPLRTIKNRDTLILGTQLSYRKISCCCFSGDMLLKLYRHGDVLVGSVDGLPEGAKKRDNVTLAYGEMTGHSHRIADPTTAETFEYEGQLYLRVIAASAELIHEEHHTIELQQGIYRVWQQREYTPGTIRTVFD